MSMAITFPGGMAVESRYRGFVVRTDQPVSAGGQGSAPSPFDLFLSALGTCAGFYALRFCQERNIPTEGLGLDLDFEGLPGGSSVAEVRMALALPAAFPEKYTAAIVRAIEHCAVKKQLAAPPRFAITVGRPPANASLPAQGLPAAAARPDQITLPGSLR